jgi:DNA (cytosine-5)-methyltransferase 1
MGAAMGLAMLPTPTAHDGSSNGISAATRLGGPSLLDQLRLAERLLPTPTAINPNDGEQPEHWLRRRERHRARRINGTGMGMPLSIAVRLLPTPTASDAKNCTHRTQRGGPSLPDQARLLPTPRATDGTKGCPAQRGSKGDLMLPSAVMRLLARQLRGTDQ